MNSSMVISLLFTFAAVVEPGSEQILVKDLSPYLPDSCINGWEPLHPPQTFVGDDLYDFINGGASIYYEYGFKQVITMQYVNPDSQYVTLELYEMNNSATAYGMYTYNTGTSGTEIDIGADALLEDYYLNFWKGRFLCTVTGSGAAFDVDALLMIARKVAEKITDKSPRPRLVEFLSTDSLQQVHIGYVKGKLGLARFYRFDNVDIIDVKEAAIASYKDYQILIFEYDGTKQCSDIFQKVLNHFRNDSKYSNFSAYEGAFSVHDDSVQYIHFTVYEQYLFAYISSGEYNPTVLFDLVINNIK